MSEDCQEGQDEVGAPSKDFECAAGQNFDDGAPGKNLDLHDPNEFDVDALHEDVTAATREATEEPVPKAPRRVQRGRKASARTEGRREQRTKLTSAKKNRNHLRRRWWPSTTTSTNRADETAATGSTALQRRCFHSQHRA